MLGVIRLSGTNNFMKSLIIMTAPKITVNIKSSAYEDNNPAVIFYLGGRPAQPFFLRECNLEKIKGPGLLLLIKHTQCLRITTLYTIL